MTDQDNAGSTESDYRKNGYSERSLEMLESEEGQLNAVFACYGSAAQHGQLFEDSLAKLVALLNDWLGGGNPVARLEKKTIGELLRLFEKKFVEEIDDWVPKFLDEARERRNFLIHKYFLTRANEMGVECGRLSMRRELVGIEAQLASWCRSCQWAARSDRGGEDGRTGGEGRRRDNFFSQTANRRKATVRRFGKFMSSLVKSLLPSMRSSVRRSRHKAIQR